MLAITKRLAKWRFAESDIIKKANVLFVVRLNYAERKNALIGKLIANGLCMVSEFCFSQNYAL